jgi:hypothetical protein
MLDTFTYGLFAPAATPQPTTSTAEEPIAISEAR